MKRVLSIALTVCVCICMLVPSTVFAAGGSAGLSYIISSDGSSSIDVKTGDIVTVVFTIKRTDSNQSYGINALQNEIVYDQEFFEYVEGSAKSDVPGVEPLFQTRTNGTNIIKVSKMQGTLEAETKMCTFQLKVIGKSGSGKVSNSESLAYDTTGKDMSVKVQLMTANISDGQGGSGAGGGSTGGGTGGGNGSGAADTDKEQQGNNNGSEPCHTFKDVSVNDWFHEAVDYMVKKGWFTGVDENTYNPNGKMNRAMFATVIARMAGFDASLYTKADFVDVADGMWYTPAIAWASEKGIVNGVGQNKFNPTGELTREQMAAMLKRYSDYSGKTLSQNGPSLSSFADSGDVSAWARESVEWAVKAGLLNGTGSGIKPLKAATRAEMSQLLMNYDKLS